MARQSRRSDFKPWLFLAVCIAIVIGFRYLRGNLPREGRHAVSAAGEAAEFLARKERWGAKTGVGDDAVQIDIAHPKSATVSELVQLPRPDGLPDRGGPGGDRFGPIEHTAYTIDAEIIRYKWEEADDQDDHIVITDFANPGATMIAEIPDPEAVDASSPWRDAIAQARRSFDSLFHPAGRFTRESAHVRITGIAFFDFIHGQSGVAPNGIELHPVIKVEVIN